MTAPVRSVPRGAPKESPHVTAQSTKYLDVQRVSVAYGRGSSRSVALNDVSLSAPAGGFLTLLGPSGSGKTTMLRAIAGLVQPTEGEIRLGDRVVVGEEISVPTRERQLGMVFQSFALWPHMSVVQNVVYPLRLRRWPREKRLARGDEVLEQVGLGGLGSRRPSELSGGQQQRVGLARAIAHGPDLLLMDEPLSNLDAQLREEMRTVIRLLQQDLGQTTVYVTHDREEALALSDRIVILRGGEVVTEGRPEQLYSDPPDAFTARFLADWNHVAMVTEMPSEVVQSLEATRPHPCTCGGRCSAMLPRTAPITLLGESRTSMSGQVSMGMIGTVVAQEFAGISRNLDVYLQEYNTTVRLVRPAHGKEAVSEQVLVSSSEVRLLCQTSDDAKIDPLP